MPFHGIDHINLNARDLDKTCTFYSDVLGMRVERREARGMKGAWLYIGEHPYVHVMHRAPEQAPGTIGMVDHFAIQATDIPAVRAQLTKAGVAFRENPLPDFDLHQIVVHDPDGNKVELNFKGQRG